MRSTLKPPASTRRRIGHEVTEARRRKGLTQTELASLIGSSRRTLSRVENGEPGVSLDTYAAITEQIGPLASFHSETPPPPDLSTFDKWTAL